MQIRFSTPAKSRPARGRRLATALAATAAAVGLMAGLSIVSAPGASARGNFESYQYRGHVHHESYGSQSQYSQATANPAFANVGADVQQALRKAGSYTRGELNKIQKKCTAQYPNEPAGSHNRGICMLDMITALHVPMINGEPWVDRPVLTGPQMDTMDQECKAKTATRASYGTCVTNSLNYFYGL